MQTMRSPQRRNLLPLWVATPVALGAGATILAVAPWPWGLWFCLAAVVAVAAVCEVEQRRCASADLAAARRVICGVARDYYDAMSDGELRRELRLRRALGRNPDFPGQRGQLVAIRLILAERGQPEALERYAEVA